MRLSHLNEGLPVCPSRLTVIMHILTRRDVTYQVKHSIECFESLFRYYCYVFLSLCPSKSSTKVNTPKSTYCPIGHVIHRPCPPHATWISGLFLSFKQSSRIIRSATFSIIARFQIFIDQNAKDQSDNLK